jgi:endonuclease/exonuclease/phosphatase family metal-dependent hydrolase
VTAGRVRVASLNTLGLPLRDARRAPRYRAIAAFFESSTVDIVNFQEVLTYRHLSALTRGMPAYRYVRYRRSLLGPAGGLVTLSRVPLATVGYHRLPARGVPAGLRLRSQFSARLKGVLVTRLAQPDLWLLNTHPMANGDGDWSPGNRYESMQRAQLAGLAGVLGSVPGPAVVCGDFNVTRDCALHRDFMARTGLVDTFGGDCPPTFRAEFLPPGKPPHVIDFILTTPAVRAEDAEVMFADLPVSDHLGLGARVVVE